MNKRRLHLKTIRTHRKYVRKMCWKLGLFWQGLTHDLSKYSHAEMSICKYWTGKGSPHQACREAIGYSPSWNHHYHKNKHHFQYWWDEDEDGKIIPVKMPFKYVVESVCDMIGAGMAYEKEKWTCNSTYNYWVSRCKGKRIMNEHSLAFTEYLIIELKDRGLDEFVKWFKANKKSLEKDYKNNHFVIKL